MKPSEVLAKAADLIAPRGAWTRGAFSRGRNRKAELGGGRWSAEPVCFCAMGALAHIKGLDGQPDSIAHHLEQKLLEDELQMRTRFCSVPNWNDHAQKREVLEVLRAASAKAAEAGR